MPILPPTILTLVVEPPEPGRLVMPMLKLPWMVMSSIEQSCAPSSERPFPSGLLPISNVKPRIRRRSDGPGHRVTPLPGQIAPVNSVLPAKAPAFALRTRKLLPVVSPMMMLPCLRLLPPQPPNFSMSLPRAGSRSDTSPSARRRPGSCCTRRRWLVGSPVRRLWCPSYRPYTALSSRRYSPRR